MIEEQNGGVFVSYYADYYPFGWTMPERNGGSSYRYAYQGQEKDPETGWEAFELRPDSYREYDGRVGRWMTTDPYSEFHSPYLAMGNNPVSLIDPDGGRVFDPIFSYSGVFLGHVNDTDFDGEIYLMDEVKWAILGASGSLDKNRVLPSTEGVDIETLDKAVSRLNFKDKSYIKPLENLFTNLVKEAYKAGVIDYNPEDNLVNGTFTVEATDASESGSGYPGARNNVKLRKDDITIYVNKMTSEQYDIYKKQGKMYKPGGLTANQVKPGLLFLGHAGNALNILTVHEPWHRTHPYGNSHSEHKKMYIRLINPSVNPLIRIATDDFIKWHQKFIKNN